MSKIFDPDDDDPFVDILMTKIKDSSTIREIGYNADSATLIVRFVAGLYTYDDVPPDVHEKFMAAESKGRFFHQQIRGKYQTTKIPEPPPSQRRPTNVLAAG